MQSMKITVGLGSPEAYEPLVRAGADEFFAGFVPFAWLEKYSNITPLNRREVLMHGIQFSTMDEMRLLAERIRENGVPVALTFNSICYRPDQYAMIADLLGELMQLGFQDWILADPALMLHLRNRGLNGRIHLSGEAGCFNPDAMRFFSRFNISRWIFPRKITTDEMSACIAAAPGAQYEAFALNERCHYSGAFCSSLHCDELEHLCRVPYRPFGADCAPIPADERDENTFGAGGCAICALPRLKQAGITHLKVVGRGGCVENLVRDVRLLRRALAMETADPQTLRRNIFGEKCPKNCYYPAETV